MSTPSSIKIHPLIATAAIIFILTCLIAVGVMLGIVPSFDRTHHADEVTTQAQINQVTPLTPAVGEAPASPPKTNLAMASEQPPAISTQNQTLSPKKTVKKQSTREHKKKINQDEAVSRETPQTTACYDCGVIESVQAIAQETPTTGVGAGVGAVVGGLLGNQIGKGNGKTLATVAGALGGGVAGNMLEKNQHTSTQYQVTVRFDDGTRQRFTMQNPPRWQTGDYVRVDGGHIYAR